MNIERKYLKISDHNKEEQDNSDLIESPTGQKIERILENEDIGDSTKEQIKAIIRGKTTTFVGPIPPPEIIAEYETILPGSADRILSMTEKQVEHRMKLESKIVTTDGIRSYLGLGAGFIIAIVGLSGSIYLGINGKNWASGIMSAGTLTGLVTVFVTGEKRRNLETEEDKE
ncbi:MAG: DUF2335 domain-containing protein [Crocosphaera sp.]